jgi:threonine dehydrogenase-like Zn-dependent dehydrogenase
LFDRSIAATFTNISDYRLNLQRPATWRERPQGLTENTSTISSIHSRLRDGITMKAARFYGAGDVRIEDIPRPSIEPDSALIDIEWCGICGSDLHEYIAGPMVVPTKKRPHAVTHEYLPVTMGHEFCGRVRQLPEGYGGSMKVGQPVMVDPRIFCGGCKPCSEFGTVFCQHLGFVGLSGRGGGLSETVAVKLANCYPLRDEVDLRLVALIEPLAVARHCVRRSGTADFSKLNVLILGGGPIGQSVVIDLKAQGVGQVIVSEPTELRLKQVAKLADQVIDAKNEDVPARCAEMTRGNGIDVVFDCAGVAPAMQAAFAALKVRGTVSTLREGDVG